MGLYMGVSENSGFSPKMDGENHGKPYFLMDDLGVKPTIFGNSHMGYWGLITPCQWNYNSLLEYVLTCTVNFDPNVRR